MDTDNPIILKRTKNSPTIVCTQRKAAKIVPTEKSIIEANKLAFNDDIGTVTNRVTTMIERQSDPDLSDKAYDVLSYRIMAGQNFQQATIDRAKGIIAKPMPEAWYSRRANRIKPDDSKEEVERKQFNMSIVADKKPYFMIYVYPHLKKEYDKHYKNSDFKFKALFGKHLKELTDYQMEHLTPEEKSFLDYYNKFMPVGLNPCVVNRISWLFEETFSGYLKEIKTTRDFDYNILKADTEYSQKNYNDIKKAYKEYLARVDDYKKRQSTERIDDPQSERRKLVEGFKERCELICTNEEELCNIVLDICYNTENSKQFAWDICGDVFIKNLLKRNGFELSFPKMDTNWDFKYMGYSFAMKKLMISEEDIQ